MLRFEPMGTGQFGTNQIVPNCPVPIGLKIFKKTLTQNPSFARMIVWIQKNEKSLEKGCVKMEKNKETKSVKGNIINAENPCGSTQAHTRYFKQPKRKTN